MVNLRCLYTVPIYSLYGPYTLPIRGRYTVPVLPLMRSLYSPDTVPKRSVSIRMRCHTVPIRSRYGPLIRSLYGPHNVPLLSLCGPNGLYAVPTWSLMSSLYGPLYCPHTVPIRSLSSPYATPNTVPTVSIRLLDNHYTISTLSGQYTVPIRVPIL